MALPAVLLPGYGKPGASELLDISSGYAWYTEERYPPGANGLETIEQMLLSQLKARRSLVLGKQARLQAVVVPRKRGFPPLDGGATFPFEARLLEGMSPTSFVVAVVVYKSMAGDAAMMRVWGWTPVSVLRSKGERRGDALLFPSALLLDDQAKLTPLLEERKRKAPVQIEVEDEIEEVDDREFERKRGRTLGANITPLIYLSTAADSPEDFRCASRLRFEQFGDKAFRDRVLSCMVLRMRTLLALDKNWASRNDLVEAIEALAPDDDFASAFCLASMCFTCDALPERKRWLVKMETDLLNRRFCHSAHFFSSYEKLEVMLKRNRVLLFEKRGPDSYGLIYPEQDPEVKEAKSAALLATRYPLVVRVDMEKDEGPRVREHAARMLLEVHGKRVPPGTVWIKVPFYCAGKYLQDASVHFEGGWAYLTPVMMPPVLMDWMVSALEKSLEARMWNTDLGEVIAKAYPGLRRACREIGDAAPRARRAKKTADDIELPDIEDAMVRVMPMCVTNLHRRLSTGDHHLRYWERLQLARTLGACGYSSGEVYSYMATHASKAAGYDRSRDHELDKLTRDMDKAKEGHARDPDHVYDLEDRADRREHAAAEGYACNTYIRMETKPDNHNGCPFAPYFDAKELEAMLLDSGQLSREQVKAILSERAQGEKGPKRACNAHLVYKAMAAVGATEDQVRKSMRETRFYVDRPKQFASYLAKLTEPKQ